MQSKDSKDATESKDTKLIDPIRWYGVLAPQSLKEAQSRFIKGTSHIWNGAQKSP
jgi:hypothetical protein